MSFKLVAQVMDIKVGSPLRKMILIKLADQANDNGICWPSYETIAKTCEISKRSVITHIQKLEEQGFLRIEKRYNKEAGKNFSNRYHLTLSRGGANAALVQISAEGGAGVSLGGAGDAPEPTNEPINEPINNTNTCEADLLVEFWNENRPPNTQVKTSVWSKKVKTRLKTFTVDEIQQAMLFVINDNWYQANNQVLIKNVIDSDERCAKVLEKSNQPQQTNYQGSTYENRQSVNHSNQQHTSQQFDTSTSSGYAAKLDADAAAYFASINTEREVNPVSQEFVSEMEGLVQGENENPWG